MAASFSPRPSAVAAARLALIRGPAAPLDWAADAIDLGYLLEPAAPGAARRRARRMRRLRRWGLLA